MSETMIVNMDAPKMVTVRTKDRNASKDFVIASLVLRLSGI
jgi:hypothetical protein